MPFFAVVAVVVVAFFCQGSQIFITCKFTLLAQYLPGAWIWTTCTIFPSLKANLKKKIGQRGNAVERSPAAASGDGAFFPLTGCTASAVELGKKRKKEKPRSFPNIPVCSISVPPINIKVIYNLIFNTRVSAVDWPSSTVSPLHPIYVNLRYAKIYI